MAATEKYLVTLDAATQEVTRLEKVGEAGELRELSLEGVEISGLGEAAYDQRAASLPGRGPVAIYQGPLPPKSAARLESD